MSRLRRVLLSTIVAASLLLPVLQADAAPRAGLPAPPFKVISTSGQTISLDNYAGRVLILDFFATWCQPCRQAIPHLTELNRKYGKQGLQILGLSVDEEGDRAIKAFSDELRINYPVALAGDQASVDYGIRSVPILYLIDKKGRIAEVVRGGAPDVLRALEQSVKRLLAEK